MNDLERLEAELDDLIQAWGELKKLSPMVDGEEYESKRVAYRNARNVILTRASTGG